MKNPFSSMGLRSKLTIIIIVIAALTTITVGGYLLYTIYNNLINEAVNELSASTQSNANAIDNFLVNEQENALFLSRLNSLQEYIAAAESGDDQARSAAKDALTQDYFEFAQTHQIYDQIRYLDETGQEIVRVNTSRDGVSTIASDDKLQNKADRGYFKNTIALGEGEIYISALDLNVENNQIETPYKPVIRYSVPVYSQGKLKGIVITNILAENFLQILKESGTPAFMVDQDGYYLYNPDETKTWGRDLKTEFTVAQDYPDFAGNLLSGNTGAFNDSNWHYTYTSITLPGESSPRWFLASQKSVEEINTSASQPLTTGFFLLVAMLAVGAFGAAIASNTFTAGLVNLTKQAEQAAAGNLNVQVEVTSQDEVGILASSFNNMTSRLRELFNTLEQRVADRTKALAATSQVSRSLSTILDRQQLVKEVVEQVKNSFNYYHTHIYFFDPEKENLVMAGGTGEAGKQMLAQGHKLPKGRGLVGRSAETNEPVLVADTTQNPDWLPNPLLPDTKSEVAVPISIGDETLGVLDVQHNIVNGLKEDDIDSLQAIANQVAIAYQNIRQYENSAKVANDLGVVAQVGIATATFTDIDRLLQEVVDLSKKSFNLYHAHIYLLNEAGDTLQLAAGAGDVGRRMVAEGRSIPFDSEQSLVARAAQTQQGVVVNDVTVDPNFLPNSLLPDTRAEMAVPMLVGSRIVGVLDVQSETIGRFTEVDVNIKTTLASQVAVALQNARGFELSKRQAQREAAINLIAQKIQSATSVENALQVAARELGHALGMKQTLVTLEPRFPAAEREDSPAIAGNA